MNYHLFPVYCHPWGTYVAVPEGYPLDVGEIPNNEDGSDWVEPEGTVPLDDEEALAWRILALRVYLEEWTTKIDHSYRFEFDVGRHRKAIGPSPDEVKQRVAELREVLDERLKYATRQGLTEVGYERALGHIREGSARDASHAFDLVNALYFVIRGEHGYAEAWDGKEVPDLRTWYDTQQSSWMVVTDAEADKLWDEDLENTIDECLDLNDTTKRYFDREKFKADCRIDGRGHSLGRYDGNENWVDLDGQTYYLYRTN